MTEYCYSENHQPPEPAAEGGWFTNPWTGKRNWAWYCRKCADLLGSIEPAGEPLFQVQTVLT